jgi:hypothetical protein
MLEICVLLYDRLCECSNAPSIEVIAIATLNSVGVIECRIDKLADKIACTSPIET